MRVQRDDGTGQLQHVHVGQVLQRAASLLPGAQQARDAAQGAGERQRAARQTVLVHARPHAARDPGPDRPVDGLPARAPAPSRVSAARGAAVAEQAPQVQQQSKVSG